jgi:hypothetical protein
MLLDYILSILSIHFALCFDSLFCPTLKVINDQHEQSPRRVPMAPLARSHPKPEKLTPSGHEDIIQDVAYGTVLLAVLTTDFYGRRLATCSSDQKINVFNYNKETQSWTLSYSWKAHDAAVLTVTLILKQF